MADYFSDEVKKELISADFTMANNEFAYTTRGQRQVGKAYCFRADPKDAGFLRTLGIDMVSVANNHVFDYGEQGFLDTLDALHAAGIPYSGGGRNLTEASAVRYVDERLRLYLQRKSKGFIILHRKPRRRNREY